MLDAVSRLAAGRTVVLVAHRPALLSLADRVVDLRPGGGAGVVSVRARSRNGGGGTTGARGTAGAGQHAGAESAGPTRRRHGA